MYPKKTNRKGHAVKKNVAYKGWTSFQCNKNNIPGSYNMLTMCFREGGTRAGQQSQSWCLASNYKKNNTTLMSLVFCF